MEGTRVEPFLAPSFATRPIAQSVKLKILRWAATTCSETFSDTLFNLNCAVQRVVTH